jgi:hypothetical protein
MRPPESAGRARARPSAKSASPSTNSSSRARRRCHGLRANMSRAAACHSQVEATVTRWRRTLRM